MEIKKEDKIFIEESKFSAKIRFLPNFDYASLYSKLPYWVQIPGYTRKEKIKKILNRINDEN